MLDIFLADELGCFRKSTMSTYQGWKDDTWWWYQALEHIKGDTFSFVTKLLPEFSERDYQKVGRRHEWWDLTPKRRFWKTSMILDYIPVTQIFQQRVLPELKMWGRGLWMTWIPTYESKPGITHISCYILTDFAGDEDDVSWWKVDFLQNK